MRIAFIVKPFQVEPLGIAYLSAILKRWRHQVRLFHVDEIKAIKEFSPRVLAYSITTGQHEYFLQWHRANAIDGEISIFGGPHATYFPEFAKEAGVDILIRGEAELAIKDVVDHLEQRGTWNFEKVVGPTRLIKNLNLLPFPDREFLYSHKENRMNPIKNVMTSRGCPFSCPYCFNSTARSLYSGEKWTRFRSANNVIRECLLLKRYPLKMIFFQDDEFLSNPELKKLLTYYKECVKVPFHCQLRVELLTPEKVKLLKEAGCYSVTFAIESGNNYIRKKLLKRNISTGQIITGAQMLRKAGIKFRAENMVGLPGETMEQMMETIELNKGLKSTVGWCSLFQPYPGLPLSEYARKLGVWDGKLPSTESFFEETILNHRHGKEVVVNIQRLFSLAVWLKLPSWFFKFLVRLPRNRVYDFLSKTFKAWRYRDLYGKV